MNDVKAFRLLRGSSFLNVYASMKNTESETNLLRAFYNINVQRYIMNLKLHKQLQKKSQTPRKYLITNLINLIDTV